MDKLIFRLAGILVMAVLVAHELLGSPMVLPPLHTADLPQNVIWLHHFSWHVGSVAMVGMISLFLFSAQRAGDFAMALIAIGMCIGFSALALGLATFESKSLWGTPAPYVWPLLSCLGVIGLIARWKTRVLKEL